MRQSVDVNSGEKTRSSAAQGMPSGSTGDVLRSEKAIGSEGWPARAELPQLPSLPGLPRLPNLPGQRKPGRSSPRVPRESTRPGFAQGFHCISSACEDTCCQGWSVPIDQVTYEKYASNESMKAHMGKLVVLNARHSSASDYGRIAQMPTGSCPFLDGQSLCGIQKQLGPEMLSVTCATYPRAVSSYAGEREEALNLSCPEAARLTLLDAELLGRPRLQSGADVAWTATGTGRYAAFWHGAHRLEGQHQPGLAIREFVLLELTDRRYPVWQRLYLAGILVRRLDALRGDATAAEWSAANAGAVAKLLADSARVSVLEILRPAMDAIGPQPDMQLQLLMELLRIRCQRPPVGARFLECVRDFEKGLGCATATSEQEILDAYAEGYSRWYLPLMERHPHVLENYLVNYVFKNHYPFGRPRQVALAPAEMLDAEGEHLLLCVQAALAQMLLIGMARCYGEGFGLEHVVKLMQSLARTIEHSPQFLAEITEFVRTHQLKNLRGIAVLLRVGATRA